jgi:hypothetical protein
MRFAGFDRLLVGELYPLALRGVGIHITFTFLMGVEA